ncbi:hypothetical protein CY34DRAFT_114794 [Suillus luteus UH-Slu-Lm8-n1]|uniref:Unplaced genomic scaffold CY34scaffold_1, whole genome shotgun sequence n=1 Tax=Suillus luteus UH-Slu-Lm8-n1 TaxID=930992 RepID=A0A0D0AHB8_9AGAM|nr:hypothetical protein CY34DRAFT_114794 [Suillus luteus UH-Slu-Lm8-n1]
MQHVLIPLNYVQRRVYDPKGLHFESRKSKVLILPPACNSKRFKFTSAAEPLCRAVQTCKLAGWVTLAEDVGPNFSEQKQVWNSESGQSYCPNATTASSPWDRSFAT